MRCVLKGEAGNVVGLSRTCSSFTRADGVFFGAVFCRGVFGFHQYECSWNDLRFRRKCCSVVNIYVSTVTRGCQSLPVYSHVVFEHRLLNRSLRIRMSCFEFLDMAKKVMRGLAIWSNM